MERVLCWLIKRLVNLHYKRTQFYAWSWGIDEHTDINILSEESYADRHRYGTRETIYANVPKPNATQRIQSVESVECDTPQTDCHRNGIKTEDGEYIYECIGCSQTDCPWK